MQAERQEDEEEEEKDEDDDDAKVMVGLCVHLSTEGGRQSKGRRQVENDQFEENDEKM